MKNKSNNIPVSMVMVGTGLMGQHHLKRILENFPNTSIPVVCEPSESNFLEAAGLFKDTDRDAPINVPDLGHLLTRYAKELDAAFIVTPHSLHHDQAKACLESGLDVLLEKPMVLNVSEAESLIEVRDKSNRLLVIAFDGGLSPAIRRARSMLSSDVAGDLLSISATIWQDWRQLTRGLWRQEPAISGGGFLFDTGAHMLNTVADLVGQDFIEVAAWFDKRETSVEINAVAIGRLASGALVTLHGSGETIPSCDSNILIFCSDLILRTSAWGQFLEVQRRDSPSFEPVGTSSSAGVWDEFLSIRQGLIPNPAPPEVGLRLARLYDALKLSANKDGRPIQIELKLPSPS
jgi:predicted dehydrogenase